MGPESFCLEWNNYQTAVTHAFKHLQDSQVSCQLSPVLWSRFIFWPAPAPASQDGGSSYGSSSSSRPVVHSLLLKKKSF